MSPVPQQHEPTSPLHPHTVPHVLLGIVIAFILLILSLFGYAILTESGVPSTPAPSFFEEEESEDSGSMEGVVCTMDAKLCPDGSSVGRVGPNCEFAPCPGE